MSMHTEGPYPWSNSERRITTREPYAVALPVTATISLSVSGVAGGYVICVTDMTGDPRANAPQFFGATDLKGAVEMVMSRLVEEKLE